MSAIIAKRGEARLVRVGKGLGYIANTRTRLRYPKQMVDSILARGYWLPDDDQSLLPEIEKYKEVK